MHWICTKTKITHWISVDSMNFIKTTLTKIAKSTRTLVKTIKNLKNVIHENIEGEVFVRPKQKPQKQKTY